MKLKNDCVRDIMLYVEENLVDGRQIGTQFLQSELKKYSIQEINYTCRKLVEANFLQVFSSCGGAMSIKEMTYTGHQFLDTIRNNKVWEATKAKISQIGSVSIPIIQDVASSIIKSKLGI